MGLADELERLSELHQSGELSEAEYAAAKQRLLANDLPPPPLRPELVDMAAPSSPAPASVGPPRWRAPTVSALACAPGGLRALGRWVQGLLIAAGALYAVSAFVGIAAWTTYADMVQGVATTTASIEADDTYWGAFGLALMATIGCAAVMLPWCYRLWGQLPTLPAADGERPRRGRGWTLGGWFVPVANLWIPKQLMDDFWRLSSGPAQGWQQRQVTPLLHWWWAAWLLGGVGHQFAGAMEPASEGAWHSFYAATIAADGLWAAAGFLLATVVSRLVSRVDERSR